MSSIHAVCFLLITSSLALSACSDEVAPFGTGSVALEWAVSPRGCEEAGVMHVEAQLTRTSDTSTTTHRVACSQGTAIIDDLTVGDYQIALQGLDERDRPIFSAPSRELVVRPDTLERLEEPLRLSAMPSTLQVGWRFEDGRVCGAHGVEQIEVGVFDESDFEVARARFDCNQGWGQITPIPAGQYTAVIEALGDQDRVVWAGITEASLVRGGVGQAEAMLAPVSVAE